MTFRNVFLLTSKNWSGAWDGGTHGSKMKLDFFFWLLRCISALVTWFCVTLGTKLCSAALFCSTNCCLYSGSCESRLQQPPQQLLQISATKLAIGWLHGEAASKAVGESLLNVA